MGYHDFKKDIDKRSIQLGLKNDEVWPIIDGPFNEKIYSKQNPKILYVLKESYDDETEDGKPAGGGWKWGEDWKDKVDYENISKSPTLQMLSYLTYGFYENKEAKDIPYAIEDEKVRSSLLKTGIINTGKMPALSETPASRLNEITRDWIDIAIKQLKEYNPDIIVFGGTYNLYEKELGLSKFYQEDDADGVRGFAIKNNKLYIDAYHPNARMNVNNYINGILALMRAFVG